MYRCLPSLLGVQMWSTFAQHNVCHTRQTPKGFCSWEAISHDKHTGQTAACESNTRSVGAEGRGDFFSAFSSRETCVCINGVGGLIER